MTSKPLKVQVEEKTKQMEVNDTPEPISLPINDLP